MNGMTGVMTFVFLILVSPVLLMIMANPSAFAAEVAVSWAVIASVATPVGWSWFKRHGRI